jgi:hypothetical protein
MLYRNDMKSHKYSLFKSNRSQASLLSNQSFHERGGSFQPSPIDSPLQSPAYPPPSTASSPLSPEDKDKDDSLARTYESDAARFYQSNPPSHGRNVLHRSQSQRTSPSPRQAFGPTINLVSPPQSTAGSPRIDEDPAFFYQQPKQEPPPKTELKKKRRFLGLGGSSSSSAEKETIYAQPLASPRLGRSISIRRAGAQPDNITTTGAHFGQQPVSSGNTSTKFPSPTVDEEPEGRDNFRNSIDKYPQRTPELPPKDPPKSPLFVPNQGQEYTYNEPQSLQTIVAPNQSHQPETAGLKSSTWDRPQGKSSSHQRNHSAEIASQYKAFNPSTTSTSTTSSHPPPGRNTSELSYPQPLYTQGSRPGSRQSQEPPSPSYNQQPVYHQRGNSQQVGAVYPGDRMTPPPTQPHSGSRTQEIRDQQNSQQGHRGQEPGYQAYQQGSQGGNQSGQPGQYGPQLVVNNQQGYRNTPQASPMVQQNSNSETGHNTPPPSRSRDDLSGLDIQQLLARHDELSM